METISNLAEFLRAARARVSPADVGINASGITARRVPGLRREEVAMLAGMSVDYYTRIEQGRIKHASDSIVSSLCNALRLTDTERGYLFSLFSTGSVRPPRARTTMVRPMLLQMIDQMDNIAAFVLGAGMEVLAMNRLAKVLLHDFTQESGSARNLARWAFLSPEARSFYLDWDLVAADMSSILRRDSSNHPNDRRLNELIGELTVKSDAFRKWWPQHTVYECSSGSKQLMHPLVGRIQIEYETFPISGEADQQLFLYSAKRGSPSEDALHILNSWNIEIALPSGEHERRDPS